MEVAVIGMLGVVAIVALAIIIVQHEEKKR